MDDRPSFEKNKIATDIWRSYLNERYSDEIRGMVGLPQGWSAEKKKKQEELRAVVTDMSKASTESKLNDFLPDTNTKSWADLLGHAALDIGGLDFVWWFTGPFAPFIAGSLDMVHAVIYAKEGKYFLSALSFACAVAGAITAGAADVPLKSFKYLLELKTGATVLKVCAALISATMTWEDIKDAIEQEGIHPKDAKILIALDDILQNEKSQKLLNKLKDKKSFGIGENLAQYVAQLHDLVEFIKQQQQQKAARVAPQIDKLENYLVAKKSAYDDIKNLLRYHEETKDNEFAMEYAREVVGGLQERRKARINTEHIEGLIEKNQLGEAAGLLLIKLGAIQKTLVRHEKEMRRTFKTLEEHFRRFVDLYELGLQIIKKSMSSDEERTSTEDAEVATENILKESEIKRWQIIAGIKKRAA